MIQTLRKDVPEIDQAAIEYERFIADQTVQYVLQNRLIADMDYHSGMQNARNEGLAEGLAITARNLKAKNFPASEIAEITGLSIQEIETL